MYFGLYSLVTIVSDSFRFVLFLVVCHTFSPFAPSLNARPLHLTLQLHALAGDLALATKTLESVKAVTGTPAAASALAELYKGMGDAEKGAAVVVAAAESANRGKHVSVSRNFGPVKRYSCHERYSDPSKEAHTFRPQNTWNLSRK